MKKDIAVIGMAVKTAFAENINEFWENLVNGKDCIHEIPDHRQKDLDDYLPHLYKIRLEDGGRRSKKRYLNAGYLKHIDKFDPRFFKLSPREASLMDPCQRVFLETAYHVLEDAGYAGSRAKENEIGIYTGYSDDVKLTYFQMVSQLEPESIPTAIAGNLSSIVPSRISYFMDLKGPALLIDTACSSSLVAVHLACQALHSGDCEIAIAGGVRINLMPIAYAAQIGIESSDGRTKAFDDDSDGTGTGEGAAAVVLKPLEKAIRDNDHIYAVIKGSAINQDGQSQGITAPCADAQARVLQKAWKNAGIDPTTLSYIEAHGTGTRVGDPTEIEAITKAFAPYTRKKQFCGIGTVKTNIGHLFEASGIFGFIKAALSLKNKTIPPLIHFNRPNKNIPFENSPVYITDQLTPWLPNPKTPDIPLRCGITAFGFSGTNCHIVLEENKKNAFGDQGGAFEKASPWTPRKTFVKGNIGVVSDSLLPLFYILPLSARSKEALVRLIERYYLFLSESLDVRFQDVCYSAAVGRGHFEYRVAITFSHREELIRILEKISKNEEEQKKRIGKVEIKECPLLTITDAIDEEMIELVAKEYLDGTPIDWESLFENNVVNKVENTDAKQIPLPLYPFDRKRCWIDIPPVQSGSAKSLEGKLYFDMEWVEETLNTNTPETEAEAGITLMVEDKTPLSIELKRMLKSILKTPVISVEYGDSFEKINDNHFRLDGSEEHYEKLLEALGDQTVHKIVFMSTTPPENKVETLEQLQYIQQNGVYHLFHLTKTLLRLFPSEKIECISISNFVNPVTGNEKIIKPEHAPLFGLTWAIDRECENWTAWCIDIDQTATVNQLAAEIVSGKQIRLVAYRDEKRFYERFVPVDIDTLPDQPAGIRSNGVYIVTGGTGGIGLEVGKYLAEKGKEENNKSQIINSKQITYNKTQIANHTPSSIKIILVNRSPMPPREQWESILAKNDEKRTVNKIKSILQMENDGAHVILYNANCSDFQRMKELIEFIKKEFGTVNGIIHGAGVEGEGLLARKEEYKFTNVLNPKIAGTWILDHLTHDIDLDFFVLFSTVATFLMNPGQTDYTAANAYLDSFSEFRNRQGKKTIAMNWVTWKETGMAVNFNANFDIIFRAIPTAQAMDAFDALLRKKTSRILIGELNLYSKLINLLKNAQFRLGPTIQEIIDKPDTSASTRTQTGDEPRKRVRKVKLSGRDEGGYSKSELLVARVWGEVLGFEQLNIDDNFYELGGDSILATQVVNRINTEHNLKISLIEIFNYETLRELAQYVEKQVHGAHTL